MRSTFEKYHGIHWCAHVLSTGLGFRVHTISLTLHCEPMNATRALLFAESPKKNDMLGAPPSSLYRCRRLHEVRLGDNEIPEIDASIGELVRLEELLMTNNLLQQLPPEIRLARSLTRLVLRNNPLANSPACALEPDTSALFSYLSALLEAVTTGKGKFSGHMMRDIPDQLLVSKGIVELDVSKNGITQIPRTMHRLDTLAVLDLSDNSLQVEIRPDPNQEPET